MSELSADYAAAGFDGRLEFGKRPALLMVDVCNAYLDPASPLYAGVEDALASNIRLLAAARAAGVPAIFTRVTYSAGAARRYCAVLRSPAQSCAMLHRVRREARTAFCFWGARRTAPSRPGRPIFTATPSGAPTCAWLADKR